MAVVSGRRITRRAFIQAAAVAAAGAALPVTPALRGALRSAQGPEELSLAAATFYFFSAEQAQTAAAICAGIIPTDTDPSTGAVVSPGATEAGAVRFIDMFLAAFDLPAKLASNPAIYLRGRYSARWPYGDEADGRPSAKFPADDFESSAGQVQFLGLTQNQAIAWYLRLYGSLAGYEPPLPSWVAAPANKWRSQVGSGEIPGAANLRKLYTAGLAAFDAWSEQNFSKPFAQASPEEQQAMLFLVWNPFLGAASSNGLPGLPAPLPNPVPPPAAASLFGVMVLHTIQGTYCLAEYKGGSDKTDPHALWESIGFDGDTQPLGNSIYDENLVDPDQSNTGFGAPGVYQPKGGYRPYRDISTPDAGAAATEASVADFAQLLEALERAGATVATFSSGSSGTGL
ncbi:MAG TPA: gluconate 2-dehydrogenase subunit 3 family protein [Acidimicrobiales bacterium]|nr:gluconate 2-dehydrogenase subunit 3 family protein [Acidimicrobiales bacterium]